MKTFHSHTAPFAAQWRRILQRGSSKERAQIEAVTKTILDQVHKGGDKSLVNLSREFDGVDLDASSLRVSATSIRTALETMNSEGVRCLQFAANKIRSFQRHILPSPPPEWTYEGTRVRYMPSPIQRLGVYVPGGSASYPSSVLANVLPAQIAGVPQIALVSPPGPDGLPSPSVLAACALLGVEEVYPLGGAQAIGALAYGTESIQPVDFIVGPGNAYVTAAKRSVVGLVGIDALAGPTEIAVIADESASPEWIAADLLSQAEHDPLAAAVLLTPSESLAQDTAQALERQLESLPRKEIARKSLESHGALIVTQDLEECIEKCQELAPEHLELVVQDPTKWTPLLTHAGAIFVGPWTPEVAGDYVAGPSHVLPTDRTARFTSGLASPLFLRWKAIVEYDRTALREETPILAHLARSEGLEGHARAAEIRFESDEKP